MGLFTVTMHGESGDLDVYENVVMDRRPDEPYTIETWDDAIRAAWNHLSPTGGGWASATVVGPYGRKVRLTAEDWAAAWEANMDRIRAAEARYEAESAGKPKESLFDDEPEGLEASRWLVD